MYKKRGSMAGLMEQTMVLTQSQKHWRSWVSALQTRDDTLRAVALEQLSKFLDYWTAELYSNYPFRGLLNGHDTPLAESWDEVFNVDTDIPVRPRKQAQVHFEPDEAWVGPYGLDEYTFDSHHIDQKPMTMNPWDNYDGSKETRETLSRYYCGIQRLVVDCPFADVRRTCRRLLDKAKRKNVEIPSLVNEGPSWLIPHSEIIGFKTDHHTEPMTIRIPEKFISDDDSSSDSDIVFNSRNDTDVDDLAIGYGYYTSPNATPRPAFTTPAIPINAPPRSRSRNRHHLSRNTSSESIAKQSTTSSRTSTKRKYVRQRHASEEIREFQISSFIAHGRVTNYAKALLYMPRYVRCTSTCYERLISSIKGISRGTKTYIALLASAEMGCQYFVSYFTAKYLEVGGDNTWLRGIGNAPGKVRRIAELNRKLVEGPWRIAGGDIRSLIESREIDGMLEEGWTLTEAVQIVTILAMFQTQSSIALGLGIVCEGDVFGGTVWQKIARSSSQEAGQEGVEDEEPDYFSSHKGESLGNIVRGGRRDIIDKLRMRMLASGHLSPDMSFDNLQKLHLDAMRNGNGIIGHDVENVFCQCLVEHQTNGHPPAEQPLLMSFKDISNSMASSTTQKADEKPVNPIIEDLSRFTMNGAAKSTVFPSTHPIFTSNHYSWDDALHILNSHLTDLAPNLDKRFHLPTSRTFLQVTSTEQIDIIAFYEALRHYSLALLGIMKEGYDYKSINQFLNDDLRAFVRRICLDPRGMLKSDWETVKDLGFSAAEIVEIGVIACEARFMGVLMYAFKAVGSI